LQVSLGTPHELYEACSKADKLPSGKHCVKAVGRMTPEKATWKTTEDGLIVPVGKLVPSTSTGDQNFTLHFNEYIVYDPRQVRLRYLMKIRFNFT
ncbi:uncharacterized protein DEA37_0010920, partial [Paragonimus westermani]